MSTVNRRHKIFIEEMIAHGDQVRAYMKAYPKSSKENARKRSYELGQKRTIKDKIEKARNDIEEAAFQAHKKEAIRMAKKRIADVYQVDAEVSDIILGLSKTKKKIVVWNKTTQKYEVVTVEQEPDHTEKIAAADKYYKRHGSYAAKEIRHEGGTSFLEFLKSSSNAGKG